MKKIALHWQILIALGLAVLAGILTGKSSGIFEDYSLQFYELTGGLFLNALKSLLGGKRLRVIFRFVFAKRAKAPIGLMGFSAGLTARCNRFPAIRAHKVFYRNGLSTLMAK